MRENGQMIKDTEKESLSSKMEINILENSKIIRKTEKANIFGAKIILILAKSAMEISSIMRDTDMELLNTRMETDIKGCTRTTADTATGYIIMQTVIDMKGNSRKIKDKDMVCFSSKVGENKR